jgi:hypothetical protein
MLQNVNVGGDDDRPVVIFPGNRHEGLRRDCDVETVYVVEDSQCDAFCKQTGTYRERNGVCVNISVFASDSAKNTCDPTKGVLAFLMGDPQFGKTKFLCLSIDQGIQPNDPNEKNDICINGGTQTIDYVLGFPQAENCRCPDALVNIPATSTVRSRGICVKDKEKHFFE